MSLPICPLCQSGGGRHFYQDSRDYYQCEVCQLVFVPPPQLLTPLEEKAVYDQHQNRPDDPHYRKFLQRLSQPLLQKLRPPGYGLDFGSGPGPTLSVMFQEAGYRMELYDPFYAADPHVFNRLYDFITASEVVEHLHKPGQELDRLWGCLRSGGVLGIMTKRLINLESFANWHYKNDPTHVCFFSIETFHWFCRRYHANLEVPAADVVLITKT